MKQKRPSQPGFTHIKDLIGQIMGNCRVSNNSELLEIQREWGRMLGNDIAVNAHPASLKNGILWIYVKTPTLTQQLRFMAKDIIRQINELAGEEKISEIKFKIR